MLENILLKIGLKSEYLPKANPPFKTLVHIERNSGLCETKISESNETTIIYDIVPTLRYPTLSLLAIVVEIKDGNVADWKIFSRVNGSLTNNNNCEVIFFPTLKN
jgi:hypothetical protein